MITESSQICCYEFPKTNVVLFTYCQRWFNGQSLRQNFFPIRNASEARHACGSSTCINAKQFWEKSDGAQGIVGKYHHVIFVSSRNLCFITEEEIISTQRLDKVQILISLLAIQQAVVGEMEFVVVSYFITFLCAIQYSGESLSKSFLTYVYFRLWWPTSKKCSK